MALQHSKGTISYMSEVESGTSRSGNEWSRMTLIIDMPGFQGAVYKLALAVSGKHVEEVSPFLIGDKVDVSWSIYAREYNGKWYNQVDLVKIDWADRLSQSPAPAQAPAAPMGVMARARAAQARQAAPAEDFNPETNTNDLPF